MARCGVGDPSATSTRTRWLGVASDTKESGGRKLCARMFTICPRTTQIGVPSPGLLARSRLARLSGHQTAHTRASRRIDPPSRHELRSWHHRVSELAAGAGRSLWWPCLSKPRIGPTGGCWGATGAINKPHGGSWVALSAGFGGMSVEMAVESPTDMLVRNLGGVRTKVSTQTMADSAVKI